MIIKASQRSGAANLARHLLNDRDNDHVEIHELRGFMSHTLDGALHEIYAVSRGTRCKQFIFSVSLNPPERARVPVEAFAAAIVKIEEKMGLDGQPRAIIFHEKKARRHAHVVWSRIDLERMRAINLPHFKRKLMDVSRELFVDHRWQLPDGFRRESERNPLNFTLAEWQQAKRAKVNPRQVKRDLQECWATSDDARAFARAVERRGYVLARGDQRSHVALDWHGEVYAIARWTGQKAKDVRARLGDDSELPSVEEAREQLNDRLGKRIIDLLKSQDAKRSADEAVFAERRKALVLRQRHDRAELKTRQEAERAASAIARQTRLPRGLKAIWWRITGKLAIERSRMEAEAKAEIDAHGRIRQHLVDAQLAERRRLQDQRRRMAKEHENTSLTLTIEFELLKSSPRTPDDSSPDDGGGRQRRRQRNRS